MLEAKTRAAFVARKLVPLILLVTVFAVGLYVGTNYPFAWFDRTPKKSLATPEPPMTEPGSITLTDLNAAPKSEVLIVDARPRLFFQRGHIPGAINIAKQYLARDLPNAEAVLNQSRGRRVIVYCTADDCDDSLFVARELLRSGMSRVYVFKGGWQEWQTAGLQEEKG